MKKITIFLDLERTRKPFTGLENFCSNIFLNIVNKCFDKFNFFFFVSKKTAKPYNNNKNVIPYRKVHFIHNNYIKKSDIIHLMWQLSSTRKMVENYFNKKIIFTIHDLNILYERGYEGSKNMLKIIQETAEKSDIITTISDFVREEVIKHLNIEENKIITIHNGVNLVNFPYFDTPKYKPKNKFIFSIGEIRRKKNFHVIIPILIDSNYDLILSGSLSDKEYLDFFISEAKRHNVIDKIKLTNKISEQEKYWYYKNCEAFLFPSLFEGFGIPPIEAMRIGKPVFLSKCTSLPEIGGDTAYYFDNFEPDTMIKNFNDGMADFNKNKELREKQLIERSNEFTMEKSIEKYLKLYESLC